VDFRGREENSMGEVAVILKVMPESPEVDMEKLQAEIKEKIPGIQDMRIEPIGFGLSTIKIAMITEDKEGSGDKIESLFAEIAGIDRAEIESLNRML
jgi:elongation factor 1-beta